jgi:hypothetical protein
VPDFWDFRILTLFSDLQKIMLLSTLKSHEKCHNFCHLGPLTRIRAARDRKTIGNGKLQFVCGKRKLKMKVCFPWSAKDKR